MQTYGSVPARNASTNASAPARKAQKPVSKRVGLLARVLAQTNQSKGK